MYEGVLYLVNLVRYLLVFTVYNEFNGPKVEKQIIWITCNKLLWCFCPLHIIQLSFDTFSFTINVIRQGFLHQNSIVWVPWPTNNYYKDDTSYIINTSRQSCISPSNKAFESVKPTDVYTALYVNLGQLQRVIVVRTKLSLFSTESNTVE